MKHYPPDNGCTISAEIHLKPDGFQKLRDAGIKTSEDDGELTTGIGDRGTGLFYHEKENRILSRHPSDGEGATAEHLSDGRGIRPFMLAIKHADAAKEFTVIRTGASQEDIELWTLDGGEYHHYKMTEVTDS